MAGEPPSVVPTRTVGPNGEVGDGLAVLTPAHPLYHEWMTYFGVADRPRPDYRWVTQNGQRVLAEATSDGYRVVEADSKADCSMPHQAMAKRGKKVCPNCKAKIIAEATVDGVEVWLEEAADSLKKASTPEPFSTSKTSNWVARGGGLPAYIQHIAHDIHEKRGMPVSRAIAIAIGTVKRWARGGGNVDENTRAAARKALAEWEALKAKAHAT